MFLSLFACLFVCLFDNVCACVRVHARLNMHVCVNKHECIDMYAWLLGFVCLFVGTSIGVTGCVSVPCSGLCIYLHVRRASCRVVPLGT